MKRKELLYYAIIGVVSGVIGAVVAILLTG